MPPDAFAAFYGAHVARVYAYVRFRVQDVSEAEDLTADIFEAALKGFAGYDPSRASEATWLFAIARNRLGHHFRRQRLRRFLRIEAAAYEPDAAALPEDVAEEREAAARVRGLLGTLDPRDREVIAMKFGAGLNNRQIASVTGMSESNVGTRLFRVLQRLRRGMEQ